MKLVDKAVQQLAFDVNRPKVSIIKAKIMYLEILEILKESVIKTSNYMLQSKRQ